MTSDVKLSYEDILVAVGHPAGAAEIPLSEWIRIGPGTRPFVRPVRARCRRSGEELPLAVIPMAFRNDHTSRALIASGQIDAPWSRLAAAPASGEESDPEFLDRVLLAELLEQILGEPGFVSVENRVGATRTDRLVLEDTAPAVLRRLASEGLWDDFDGIAQVAADLGLPSIATVLCEVLESEVYPRVPVFFIDTLAQLGTPGAVPALVDQLARFVDSGTDPVHSRRCLYALYGLGTSEARRALSGIALGKWPSDVRKVAQYLSTHMPADISDGGCDI
jgi:hypothetical protein